MTPRIIQTIQMLIDESNVQKRHIKKLRASIAKKITLFDNLEPVYYFDYPLTTTQPIDNHVKNS